MWDSGPLDLSLAPDGSINFSVGHPEPESPAYVTASATISKDTIAPTISANITTAGTYTNNATISHIVTFSEEVSISGQPRIEFLPDTSTGNAYAAFSEQTDATNLIFAYTVRSGEEDLTGLDLAASIDLNGGSIADLAGNPAVLALSSTNMPTVFLDALGPSITAVTVGSGNYSIGEFLDIIVTYDGNVTLSGSSSRLELFLESASSPALYADYLSGTGSSIHTYRYTISATDQDTDGIAISSSIDLNGDTALDNAGNNAILNLPTTTFPTSLVDGIIPTVTITTAPVINSLNQLVYSISGTCSESGESVNLAIGAVDATAACNESSWTLAPTDVSSNSETSALTIAADLDDAAGNTAITATLSVLMDTTPPSVTANTTAAGTYLLNSNVTHSITFSEDVAVSGDPRIEFLPNSTTGAAFATLTSGSGSDILTFGYTVRQADEDSDGVSIAAAIDLNSGSISDLAGNPSNLGIPTLNFPLVLLNGTGPVITNVSIATGTYGIDNPIDIVVTYDENVTLSGFSSRIELFFTEMNSPTIFADYLSGSGTTTHTYRYNVVASDADGDGVNLGTNIDLNGDTAAGDNGNPAVTLLATTFVPTVLVDGILPTVSITTTDTINSVNQTSYVVTGDCSEIDATVNLTIGMTAATANCNGSNWTTAPEDVSANTDSSSITITADIADMAGNDAITASNSVIKDTNLPEVNITSAPDINITNSSAYIISGSCSENTSDIVLGIGDLSISTTCSSGAFTTAAFNTDSVIESSATSITADITDPAGNSGTQTSTTILIDRTAPTLTITSAPDISAANQESYSIVGSCSENGRSVNINIGSINVNTSCSGLAFFSGNLDVSALADGNIDIAADHTDQAGNTTNTASTTVTKLTAFPTVTLNTPSNIDSANVTSYSLSGSCSENDRVVTAVLGGGDITFVPNCSSGTWSITNANVSAISDAGSISITVDHQDAGGQNATTATATVSKDIVAPTVTISAAGDINASNASSYQVSGTCSESGLNVEAAVGTLTFTTACSGSTWTTGIQDVASIADDAIAITADHQNSLGQAASTASLTVTKTTAAPAITNLSAPLTLSESASLIWQITGNLGFTIEDYVINYRVKSTPTWIVYTDGTSNNAYADISGLTPNTTYEFRVQAKYSVNQTSPWSNITEAATKPNNAAFTSPYQAMNVGGATSASVVAFEDATAITLNASPLITLNKGQVHTFATSHFDIIDADKPIYTAGYLGSGSSPNQKANITFSPTNWAGKSFSFNTVRFNAQKLPIYALEDTVVELYQGATLITSLSLTKETGGTLSWSVYGSFQLRSTGTILAFHYSSGDSNYYGDPSPLLPSSTEIIGIPSSSMRLTSDMNNTNYNYWHSNSTTGSGSVNQEDSIQINPQGSSSLYNSSSLIIKADRKVSGASFADSNGYCSSVFLPTNLMKTKYAINTNSDYVAFASKEAGTIAVYSPTQVIGVDTPESTLTLSQTSGSSLAPFKARLATTAAGYRFISTVPMAAWYQPDNDVGGADEDETILYGTD